MNLLKIKQEIRNGGFDHGELAELIAYTRAVMTDQAKDSIQVGSNVWVIQKTKRTAGVVIKVNIKKCLVDMKGSRYNVPLSMLEVQ
jgi:hypothetical protein|tara:strand:+ start:800 stop:1057 length:258 start_codon:yes stop_codon:yes gene_type:complete